MTDQQIARERERQREESSSFPSNFDSKKLQREPRSREGQGEGEMVMAVGSNGDVSGDNAEEAAAQIPASVKRIIQSLKEIVIGCDEDEIFAMLKDCDMDPNDTVQRLLSIGLFSFFLVFVFAAFLVPGTFNFAFKVS